MPVCVAGKQLIGLILKLQKKKKKQYLEYHQKVDKALKGSLHRKLTNRPFCASQLLPFWCSTVLFLAFSPISPASSTKKEPKKTNSEQEVYRNPTWTLSSRWISPWAVSRLHQPVFLSLRVSTYSARICTFVKSRTIKTKELDGGRASLSLKTKNKWTFSRNEH